MNPPRCPMAHWRARVREAAISRSSSRAKARMPGATRKMAAMLCWRRRILRFALKGTDPRRPDGQSGQNRRWQPEQCRARSCGTARQSAPAQPRTCGICARNEIESLIAKIKREHDVSIHLHGSFNRPPKPIDAEAEKLFGLVKQCGADLGLTIGWKSTGGVCDGNNIAACGVPVVDTMGVRGGSIHSADEYLITESLSERAALSALTLMRIAEKGSL